MSHRVAGDFQPAFRSFAVLADFCHKLKTSCSTNYHPDIWLYLSTVHNYFDFMDFATTPAILSTLKILLWFVWIVVLCCCVVVK